jgi:hypothetical protein
MPVSSDSPPANDSLDAAEVVSGDGDQWSEFQGARIEKERSWSFTPFLK